MRGTQSNMNKVITNNYVTVQGWMVNDLDLKGNDLLVYAIIYGFSQAEEQHFTGSLQYLADWTNSTKRGVQKSLKNLLERGLIQKEDKIINGVKFVEYWRTEFHGIEQSSMGYGTKFHGGIEQSSTNNIVNNIEDTIDIKRFRKPTIDEVKAYCKERNNKVDAEKFIDYYESNGWRVGKNPMKDWRACIRSWERNNYSNHNKKNQTVPDYMLMNDFGSNEGSDTSETEKLLEKMRGVIA